MTDDDIHATIVFRYPAGDHEFFVPGAQSDLIGTRVIDKIGGIDYVITNARIGGTRRPYIITKADVAADGRSLLVEARPMTEAEEFEDAQKRRERPELR